MVDPTPADLRAWLQARPQRRNPRDPWTHDGSRNLVLHFLCDHYGDDELRPSQAGPMRLLKDGRRFADVPAWLEAFQATLVAGAEDPFTDELTGRLP